MIFACQRCKTNYRLADERIKGKVLRFTCPKCGQVHFLRDPEIYDNPVEAVVESAPHRSSKVFAPETVEAKRTVSLPTVGPRPTTQTGALPATPEADLRLQDTWYAVKKGERIGPFRRDQILMLLLDGTLHERSFVWRPTMPAWKRMSDVPELSDVLEEFIEQKRKQLEAREAHTPPPLPAVRDESSPAVQPAGMTGSLPGQVSSGVSTEQSDSIKAIGAEPTESGPSTLPQVEGTQAPKEARQTFFGRVLVLDETRWPETPSVLKETRETPSMLQRETPKLSEFSVLMRITKASRKKTIITYSIVVFLLGIAVGTVSFLVLTKSPAQKANIAMGLSDEQPTFQQVLYTVRKQKEVIPEEKADQPQKVAMTKPRRVEKPDAHQPALTANKPTQVEVAPEVKEEFERYASLAKAAESSLRPVDVSLEQKPRTLTELPSRKLTQESLENIFKLNWKRLVSCKHFATKYRDTTMQVVIQFVIGEDGQIKNLVVRQEGGFVEDEVIKCIKKNIMELTFPPQESEVPVRWPLIF